MAGASQEYKKVEHRVYILHFVEAVKNRTNNVGNTLTQHPKKDTKAHSVPKLFHSNNYGKAHKHIAYGLYFVMFFQCTKANDGTGYGT